MEYKWVLRRVLSKTKNKKYGNTNIKFIKKTIICGLNKLTLLFSPK